MTLHQTAPYTRIALMLLVSATLIAQAPATNAETSSDDDLRTQVEELRQLVIAQQKRIEKLEHPAGEPLVAETTGTLSPAPATPQEPANQPVVSSVNRQ